MPLPQRTDALRRKSNPFEITGTSLFELTCSLDGPRPQQIGVRQLHIHGRAYPVRVFESLDAAVLKEINARATARIEGSNKMTETPTTNHEARSAPVAPSNSASPASTQAVMPAGGLTEAEGAKGVEVRAEEDSGRAAPATEQVPPVVPRMSSATGPTGSLAIPPDCSPAGPPAKLGTPLPLKAGLYSGEPDFGPDAPPRLHQSLAAVLVNYSPLHCWWKAFGAPDKEYHAAARLGQIAHALLLGGGNIVEVDAEDFKPKAAREQQAAAIATGKMPILKSKLGEARTMVARVERSLSARGIQLQGRREITAVWQAPNGVWCQGRLDHLIVPEIYLVSKAGKRRRRAKKWLRAEILDFKFTSVEATKKKCEAKIVEYGYDIQHAAYVQAIETLYPELAGRVKMSFVFVEVKPPHAVRIMPLAGQMREYGAARWLQACIAWEDCMEKYGAKNPWPGYADDKEPAECPAWVWNKLVAEMDQLDPEESGTA